MRGVEVVFHLAARASVPRSVAEPRPANEINVTGTLNLLIAAKDAGARRFVYSASSARLRRHADAAQARSTCGPQPLSPYAVSKLAAEHYCACWCARVRVADHLAAVLQRLRPAAGSPGAVRGGDPRIRQPDAQGRSRRSSIGDGEQSRDFCFIENVVNANMLAAEAQELHGEVVNVACGERTTLNEIVADINKLLGTNIKPEYEPPRAGDVRDSLADMSEARRRAGLRAARSCSPRACGGRSSGTRRTCSAGPLCPACGGRPPCRLQHAKRVRPELPPKSMPSVPPGSEPLVRLAVLG